MLLNCAHLLRLVPILAIVLLGLAGCGKVPVMTQWKLRSFNALTFDPAEPRVAVLTTERLRALPGGAKLMLRHWRKGDEDNKIEETFVLQESSEFAPPAVMAQVAPGQRVSIFRVSAPDVLRIRLLQASFAERARTAPNTTGAEVKADITACRTGDLPAAVAGTVFLKLDADTGYLPLMENIDIRELAAAEGSPLEAQAKPCPAAPAKRS